MQVGHDRARLVSVANMQHDFNLPEFSLILFIADAVIQVNAEFEGLVTDNKK